MDIELERINPNLRFWLLPVPSTSDQPSGWWRCSIQKGSEVVLRERCAFTSKEVAKRDALTRLRRERSHGIMEIKTAAQKQIDIVKRAEGCEFTHADQALLNRAEEIDRKADSRITVLHNRLVELEDSTKNNSAKLDSMAAQLDALRSTMEQYDAKTQDHFDVIDDYLAQGMEAASSYVPEPEPLNPDMHITIPRSMLMRIINSVDDGGRDWFLTSGDQSWISEFVASEMRTDQWTKLCEFCENGAYTDQKGTIVKCTRCHGRGKVRRPHANQDAKPELDTVCKCTHSESDHAHGIGKPLADRYCKQCMCQEFDPKPEKSWCGECSYCDMGNYAKCITLDKYGESIKIEYKGRTVTGVSSTARCVNCDHHEEDHEEDGCIINMSDGPTPCGCPIFSGVAKQEPEPEIITAMDDPMRNERCFVCGHLRYEHMGVDGSGPCDDGWFESPDRCQCRKFVPEPIVDQLCQCDHRYGQHFNGTMGACFNRDCRCLGFVAKNSPEYRRIMEHVWIPRELAKRLRGYAYWINDDEGQVDASRREALEDAESMNAIIGEDEL